MLSTPWTPTLLAFLGLESALGATLTDTDVPSDPQLRRTWAKATVLGNYVYIEGGEIINGSTEYTESSTVTVNSTLSIDMSKSWRSADVLIRKIPKAAPPKSNVGLWTDVASGTFYSWGGVWPWQKNMSDPALWKFTADGEGGGTWSLELAGNPGVFDELYSTDSAAFANTNHTGFAIGGVAIPWSERPPRAMAGAIPGLLTFNFKTLVWRNATADFGFFENLIQASAHYLPAFGPSGLIFHLGGYAPPPRAEDFFLPALDLRNITFFNPQTRKRHWQRATGSVPPTPRGEACTAVFPTVNGGYDIFFFGGSNVPDNCAYKDAYILSLPGFVWIKLPDPPGGRRAGATCVQVGKRQVLSIGGYGPTTDPEEAPQGLLLFDMTALEWKYTYDAGAAEYERPQSLRDWYSNGSLDKVKWSSDEVQALFETTDTTTDSTADPGPRPAPVGPIVGGVIGGVAAAAVIGVATWLFLRRRRKQHQQGAGVSDLGSGTTNKPGHGTEGNAVAGIPESPAAPGYTELPVRSPAATYYPFGEPVEMDPHGRPAEMEQPATRAELDARPRGYNS